MIKISVDESYAFDNLAILFVKLSKKGLNPNSDVNYLRCLKEIKDQIGLDKFNSIINSPEYFECIEANKITFEVVDKAKTDKVLASYVDQCNFRRYGAKRALQFRHFGGTLSEFKIGYECYSVKG